MMIIRWMGHCIHYITTACAGLWTVCVFGLLWMVRCACVCVRVCVFESKSMFLIFLELQNEDTALTVYRATNNQQPLQATNSLIMISKTSTKKTFFLRILVTTRTSNQILYTLNGKCHLFWLLFPKCRRFHHSI